MMTAREMACKSNQISSGWPCSLLVYRWLDGRNNRNVFSYQSASVVTNRHRKNTKGRRWKDIPQHVTAEFLHRHTASPQIVMQWRQTSNKASKAAILSITTSLLQLLKHFKPKRPHQHTHTHTNGNNGSSSTNKHPHREGLDLRDRRKPNGLHSCRRGQHTKQLARRHE
jgi:hypothetical protein